MKQPGLFFNIPLLFYFRRRAILGNADVSGGAPWQRSFSDDFWGTPLTDSGSHGSWRPLCVLSFRLNYLLGGGFAPWGFHLVNNLLHCVATGLVVQVARTLLASVWAVLATGALFAAHPIHTEAVAGLVGRADVAACVCYLLTYLSYLRHMRWRESGDTRQWLALASSLLLAVAGLLFKETAITALLVCILFDVLRGLSGQVDKVSRRTSSIQLVFQSLLSATPSIGLHCPGSSGVRHLRSPGHRPGTPDGFLHRGQPHRPHPLSLDQVPDLPLPASLQLATAAATAGAELRLGHGRLSPGDDLVGSEERPVRLLLLRAGGRGVAQLPPADGPAQGGGRRRRRDSRISFLLSAVSHPEGGQSQVPLQAQAAG